MKLRITILKHRSWYFCQISLQIMLLPIQIVRYNDVAYESKVDSHIAQLTIDMFQIFFKI